MDTPSIYLRDILNENLEITEKSRMHNGIIYFRAISEVSELPKKSAIRSDIIILAVGLYMIGFAAGVIMNLVAKPEADSFYEIMVERLRGEFEDIEGAFRIFTKILLHNLTICAIMAFGGIVFTVPAAFILLANGLPLGLVLARSEKPVLVFIGSILPHGLFEFPAIFLAGSFGILLGIDSFKLIWYWMKGEGEAPTRILLSDLRKVLKAFILVVILLVVAAGIETLLFIIYVE